MQNVYDTVTERILASLEAGIIPWRKDWKDSSGRLPVNHVTKKSYRGINVITLLCGGAEEWLTYKQAQSIGAQVRKGSKGCPVVFWKFDNKRVDEKTGEESEFAFAKQYTVFSVDQCDGITPQIPFDRPAFDPIAAADAVVDGWLSAPGAPSLAHGGHKAYYAPALDAVQMPPREAFKTSCGYYSTLFHEFVHSTGHKSRLDRMGDKWSKFGSELYSKEELVAEFGAAFICAESGISNADLETNSAAYIQSWMRVLKADRTLALGAAQRAQKAADLILRRSATVSEDAAAAA